MGDDSGLKLRYNVLTKLRDSEGEEVSICVSALGKSDERNVHERIISNECTKVDLVPTTK